MEPSNQRVVHSCLEVVPVEGVAGERLVLELLPAVEPAVGELAAVVVAAQREAEGVVVRLLHQLGLAAVVDGELSPHVAQMISETVVKSPLCSIPGLHKPHSSERGKDTL